MKKNILILCMAAVMLSACGGETKTLLFNGENLNGWVEFSGDTTGLCAFSVKDGVIAMTGHPHAYLRTEEVYSNYTLHVEWRWAEGILSDSGIFVMVQDEDKVWPLGVEVQLKATEVGDLVPLAGSTFEGVTHEEGHFDRKPRIVTEDVQSPTGEWNVMEVECRDNHVSVTLGGVLLNECDCLFSSGYIGIQSEGGPMEFRNIYITE